MLAVVQGICSLRCAARATHPGRRAVIPFLSKLLASVGFSLNIWSMIRPGSTFSLLPNLRN
jgi:hypothetical protein